MLTPALAVLLGLPACMPDSVTEARDQLRRGPPRAVTVSLALAEEAFTIGEFLPDEDTATTASGLIGVRFSPDSIVVDVGDQLTFENVALDPFTFSYTQMLETQQVSTSIALPVPPPGRAPSATAVFAAVPTQVAFDTPEGSQVDGATVSTGAVVRTFDNGTSCDATVSVTLEDADGDPIAMPAPAFVATGTTFVDTFSVAGAQVDQFVEVDPSADFGGCVPAPGGTVATVFTFLPMTLSTVSLSSINETFTRTYAALASETRLQAVDSVTVATGSLTLTVQNRLPIQLDVDITVQGITVGGAPLMRNVVVPAAPDGSTTQTPLVIDLTGAVIEPGNVLAVINGVAAAPTATVTAAAATNAVQVDGTGTLTAAVLVGVLDPAVTPELNVAVENTQEVDQANVDFGDFEDAVRGSTINDATFTFAITNSLATPITLDGYQVGLALTDQNGDPQRDGGGAIIYQTDGAGAPITLTLAPPGQTQLVLPPTGSATVALAAAAPLLDRLVHLLLDDSTVALVGSGTAVVGDGATRSRILASDDVVIDLDLLIGLDITLPDSGVVFSSTTVQDGAGLDSADADAIAEHLELARATLAVTNGVPYRVEVEAAMIGGDLGDGTDVFTLPGRVEIAPISLAAAAVDGAGRATQAVLDTAEAQLTGSDARVLLGERITATVRIRILPPTGSGGRGALRGTDEVVVDARATVTYQTGADQ